MRLTEKVHHLLEAELKPGATAIDATAGNGHDTLQLARLVGPEGRVLAFDTQAFAIEATRQRLIDAGQFLQCQLHQQDHANGLADQIARFCNAVATIVFNLGYLPGSDHSIQTTARSTLPALDAAAILLRPGGLLLVTAYRGHPGGPAEADAVADWMQLQKAAGWLVEPFEPQTSGPRRPPILWLGRKPA